VINSTDALAALWLTTGGNASSLNRVILTGREQILTSSFGVGVLAQTSIAAAALAAAELWRIRTGQTQSVSVDMRHAVEEFRSERRFLLDGQAPRGYRDPLAGIYACSDGNWARPHLTFPQHREGILQMLGCDPHTTDKQVFASAISRRDAIELESRACTSGLPLAALRTFEQWDLHPQASVVSTMPLVAIERIGDAPPRALPVGATRPLSAVRVLELARIIAGPVCGRSLAAHGADVLGVSAVHLPSVRQLAIDTGRGKLSCHIDLREEGERSKLRSLVTAADVFVQAYRPGALASLGFGADEVAALRPGIVYAELSAWGWSGPWASRRGYDSLVQTATGFNHAEAEAAGQASPLELPVQALDHASGYLLALGTMRALARQSEEGGSWQVRVCLARTGDWLRSFGRQSPDQALVEPADSDVASMSELRPSGYGEMRALRHAAVLSETPAQWHRPSVPLGTSAASWP
jgi:crotonobetainyl-CoA:carnitine CoA-transferase CaiB-like acyl-CoA transferase